jgi:hypothetical protein
MANPPYYLQLLIGPGVPVPMPAAVMEALASVQVTSNTDGPSYFQLTFSVSTRSPLNALFLIANSAQIPIMRVVLLVIVRGLPDVLMDGVITNCQLQPGAGGQSTLTVTGEDLSKLMDYIPLDGIPYPSMAPHLRVRVMLAKYGAFGITPIVIPPISLAVFSPTEHIPRQQGTDLDYIKDLASESGYEFYVDPGPLPLQSIAYWGPSIRVGIPQPALNTDMDAETNVESMDFNFDAESAGIPIVMIYPKKLKFGIPVPIPNINPFAPPLALIPPLPKRADIDRDSSRKSVTEALLSALGRAAKNSDSTTVSGSLDVTRYGRVLKARKLVGVRGAGQAYDGLYFVKSVIHNIKPGEYKQNFSLVRNGLISTVPRVPA